MSESTHVLCFKGKRTFHLTSVNKLPLKLQKKSLDRQNSALACFVFLNAFFFLSCPSSAFIYDESMSYLNLPIVSLFDLFWFIFHHPEMSVFSHHTFLCFSSQLQQQSSHIIFTLSLSLSLYNVTLVRFIFSTCHFRVELLIFLSWPWFIRKVVEWLLIESCRPNCELPFFLFFSRENKCVQKPHKN